MANYKLPLIDGREIDFTSLKAEDADKFYQTIISQSENPDLEEYIFNIVTDGRYRDEMDSFDAGIILVVVYSSFSLSGVLVDIKDLPSLIEEARDTVSYNAYNLLYTTILKAMPSYKLEELKIKSLNELLEMFAIAESVIGTPNVDTAKLREILGVPKSNKKASGKYSDRHGKGVALVKENELKSLTEHLNLLQEADFDETGKYIGDGNLL
jgi:hypothetical protein